MINDIEWMTFMEVSKRSGWTLNALYELKKKGKLRKEFHWRKKEGRLVMHIKRFNEWIATDTLA